MLKAPPSLISHIDPSLYAWHTSPTASNFYQRRALGAETKWARQKPGSCQLYLSGRLSLKDPSKTIRDFGLGTQTAWLRLLFEHPEVASRPSIDGKDGGAVVKCHVPKSEDEAIQWAMRTLRVDCDAPWGVDANGAEEVLREMEIGDPVCVRIHPRLSGKGLEAEYAFCFDHQSMDGVGAHIVAGKFFWMLAEELGGKGSKNDWEKCAENLPPPWVGIMNDKQKIEGRELEEGAKGLTSLVLESTKSEWGIKFRSSDQYTPKSIHRSFSAEQSTAILRSIKDKLGPTYSITYLGHAATALMILKSKPQQDRPGSNSLVSPLFMNGRRYLDSSRKKAKDYVPLCRAFGAIEFRDVDSYILSDEPSKEEVQGKLKIACEEARRSYQGIREQESILTESISVAESMATTRNDLKEKCMADPFFLSDGIIEQYIKRMYHDKEGGHEILSVDDVRFTADPDGTSLIIRMSNFRDIIRLSAEWNGACYVDEDMKKFFDGVVDLILSIT